MDLDDIDPVDGKDREVLVAVPLGVALPRAA